MITNELSEQKMTINELSEEDLGRISGGDLQEKVTALVQQAANALEPITQQVLSGLTAFVTALFPR